MRARPFVVAAESIDPMDVPRGTVMVRGRGLGVRFLINGREFDHLRIGDRVRLSDVEEWEYINNTDMDHHVDHAG